MKPCRILLVDDHEMIRKGLRSVLQAREEYEVCGEAGDGREAVEKALSLSPDVVVMDLTMPNLNGLDATRRILSELPRTQVLILSMHESEQLLYEVFRAGARGYVLKSDMANVIFDALDRVRNGKPFFSSGLSDAILTSVLQEAQADASTPRHEPLTSREREIVQLIAEGQSSREVASALGISAKTAETHRANFMRKLNLHSVSEVVRYAIRNNIIAP